MTNKAFSLRYDIDHPEPANDPQLASVGFKLFKAQGKVWAHKLSAIDVETHFPGGFVGKCACSFH